MINKEEINKLLEKLSILINNKNKQTLISFPVDYYIEELRKYPKTAHYKFISDKIALICSNILNIGDQELLELYHQLVLVKLIEISVNSYVFQDLPTDIRDLYINGDKDSQLEIELIKKL